MIGVDSTPNSRKAIEWPDGWGISLLHGVRVRDEDITGTPAQQIRIRDEATSRLRRVLLEKYGFRRNTSETLARSWCTRTHYGEPATTHRCRMTSRWPWCT